MRLTSLQAAPLLCAHGRVRLPWIPASTHPKLCHRCPSNSLRLSSPVAPMAPSCPSTPSTAGAPRPAGSGPRLPIPRPRRRPAGAAPRQVPPSPIQGAVMDAAPRIPPPASRRRSSDPRNGCSAAGSAPMPRSRPFPMPASPAPSSIASPGSRQVLFPASCLCARGRRRASRLLAPASWATRTAKAQRSSSPLAAARDAKVRFLASSRNPQRQGLAILCSNIAALLF